MRNTLLQCVTVCSSVLRCFCSVCFQVCRDMYMTDTLLQCVAVCSSVLQYVCIVYILSAQRHVNETYVVAVCCGVLQCVAVCCSVLRCVAVCLHFMFFSMQRHRGLCALAFFRRLKQLVCCSVLQCVAVCCSVL